MRRIGIISVIIVTLALLSALGSILTDTLAQDIEVGKRAKAAQIFESGTKLFIAGKYSEAMTAFLVADEIEPSNASLMSAARAALKAMNYTKAAEISLRLVVRYSDLQTRSFPLDTLDNAPEMICITRTEVEALERQLSTALRYIKIIKQGGAKLPENPF